MKFTLSNKTASELPKFSLSHKTDESKFPPKLYLTTGTSSLPKAVVEALERSTK